MADFLLNSVSKADGAASVQNVESKGPLWPYADDFSYMSSGFLSLRNCQKGHFVLINGITTGPQIKLKLSVLKQKQGKEVLEYIAIISTAIFNKL